MAEAKYKIFETLTFSYPNLRIQNSNSNLKNILLLYKPEQNKFKTVGQ